MNWYDAMEEAYKKGYEKGQEDAQKDVRHGRWNWITEDIYGCTNCGETSHVKEVMGQPDWDYCPCCGAIMGIAVKPSCERCANDGMDVPHCKECPASGFLWFREKV